MVPTKFLVGTTLATNGITRVTRKGRPNYPIDFKRHLAALACEPVEIGDRPRYFWK